MKKIRFAQCKQEDSVLTENVGRNLMITPVKVKTSRQACIFKGSGDGEGNQRGKKEKFNKIFL